MIIDHRTYTVHPGRMADLLKLYEAEGLPVQSKYLGQPHGWYVSMDIGALNQVVHMWKYADLADREQRRAQLAKDPAWGAYLAKAMPLIQHMENKILRAAPFFTIA
jgi:hypothetical protein